MLTHNISFTFYEVNKISKSLKNKIIKFYDKFSDVYTGKVVVNNTDLFINDNFYFGIARINNIIVAISTIKIINEDSLLGIIKEKFIKKTDIAYKLLNESLLFLKNKNIKNIYATTELPHAKHFFIRNGFEYGFKHNDLDNFLFKTAKIGFPICNNISLTYLKVHDQSYNNQ